MNCKALLLLCAAMTAPAMAEGTFDWTGFHAGINAGYGGGQFRMPMAGSITSPPNTYNLSGKLSANGGGFVGGGQIGYDYLFPEGWLLGFEADAEGTTINPQLTSTGPLGSGGSYNLSFGSSLDFLGTGRARVGYVMPENNMLLYTTAGIAYGGVGLNAALHAQSATDHGDATLDRFGVDVGWTAGAGVEYPVTDRISLRAEYLYVDLGSHTVVNWQLAAPSLTGSGSIKVATNAHIARLALNYTFH